MIKLRAVGFWVNWEVLDYNEKARKACALELELPDPERLLQKAGKLDEQVLEYLRSGRELWAQLGYSYCRFHCGIPDEQMGSRDLTDGVWVWPEGLVHYIEVHKLPLPEEFLATMEHNQWHVPEVENIDKVNEAGRSFAFWKDWYERKTAK